MSLPLVLVPIQQVQRALRAAKRVAFINGVFVGVSVACLAIGLAQEIRKMRDDDNAGDDGEGERIPPAPAPWPDCGKPNCPACAPNRPN